MHRFGLWTLAGVAAFCMAPGHAAVPSASQPALQSVPGQVTPAPDEIGAVPLIERASRAATQEEALRLLDLALEQSLRPTRFRGSVQYFRAGTLMNLSRLVEARKAAEEAVRLLPDDTVAAALLGTLLTFGPDIRRGLSLIVQALEESPEIALRMVEPEVSTLLLRMSTPEMGALRDRFVIALVKGGYADAHPSLAAQLVTPAIISRLAANDLAGAKSLLSAYVRPQSMLPLIVDRRFSGIWPELEITTGGDLHSQRVASVAAAKATFLRDPTPESRFEYTSTLFEAGYESDALTLLNAVLDDQGQWGDNRWAAAVAVNQLARNAAIRGDIDGTLAIRRRFLAISPAKQFPQASNVAINQARLLAALGRKAEANIVLDAAEVGMDGPLNLGPGPNVWFTSIRACVAEGAAATTAIRELEQKKLVNEQAYRDSLACRGELQALADTLLSAMGGADYDSQLVYTLRKLQIDPQAPRDLNERTWRAAANDPRVMARLDAISRPIPPGYRAAALNWRQ